MIPLVSAAYLATRRALATDQRREVPCSLPLWRLLWDEAVLLARRIGRWNMWSVRAGAGGAPSGHRPRRR